jgi:hypothetical protein
VQGNIFGLGTGNENLGLRVAAIDIGGNGNLIGSPTPFQNGKGNTIKNTRGASSAGIRIRGNNNTLRSNFIQSNQGAGVSILDQATGNVIGDDSDTFLSNNISQNTGNAIELVEDGTDENLIKQNRGFGNSGLFIDLGNDGPGNAATGPNGGIAAPVITTANPDTAAGTSTPGATIRLYERDTNAGAGLSTFFGTATADGSGHWTFDLGAGAFNPPPAADTPLVATQTAASSQNTSELSAEAVVKNVPAAPSFTGTDPASPANNNGPRIKGTSAAGTTVKLYANASCTGTPAATGTAADFASPGFQVGVADNSSTSFHATAAEGLSGDSPCSSSSITYVESTPAAASVVQPGVFQPGPLLPSAAALLASAKGDLGDLAKALRKAGIDGLLRSGGVSVQGHALTGGTLQFGGTLTGVTSSASTKLLSGKRTFTAAGKAKIRLKLTKKGRKKLRRARRARLRLTATFTDTARKKTKTSAKTTIKRKRRRR